MIFEDRTHTLEMKKHVGSIILEHLSDKLDVDILNVDLLWCCIVPDLELFRLERYIKYIVHERNEPEGFCLAP